MIGESFFPEPNRIDPKMPPGSYVTYQVSTPKDVMIKTACEATDCLAFRYGWETTVDERTPLGMAQARYIRTMSGRTFRESKTGEGLTVFRFERGQRCFTEHQTRPETWSVLHGDWRASEPLRTHVNAGDWLDDFATHQDQLADEARKG